MLNAQYIVKLQPDSLVETEGGPEEADSVAGLYYDEYEQGFHNGEYKPTLTVTAANGGFIIAKSDVLGILEV